MATRIQRRRGTATENNAFTGALGEFTYDETNHTIRVHDGVKQGGYILIVKTSSQDVPFAGTAKCKITYDAQGLVTGGADLETSDIPDLSAVYATIAALNNKLTKNTAITPGTKCKVTFDANGLITAGGDLALNDIPDLSSVYDTKMEVVTPSVASGVWTLRANKLNRINLTASATMSLPQSAALDLTKRNQILVQLKMVDPQQVNLGTTNYLSGVAPDMSQAGVYNIYYEWDYNDNAWYVGAVLKKAIV